MTEPRAGRRPSREISLASGAALPEPSANSRRQLEESLSASGKQGDKSQGPRLIFWFQRVGTSTGYTLGIRMNKW